MEADTLTELGTMTDYRAVAAAITAGKMTEACEGFRAKVVASDEPLHPLGAVRWLIESAGASQIILDATIRASRHWPFFASRLAGALALTEAAHGIGRLTAHTDIMMSLGDWPATRGIAFCSFDSSDLLVPDPVFVGRDGYQSLRHAWRNPTPWMERERIAFWRGGTAGHLRNEQTWKDLPRVRLCEFARGSRLYDVALSHIIQGTSPEQTKSIQTSGLLGERVPETHFDRYRYHIDIDGHTNSWPGLFIKLLSGSPVLKIASPRGYRQWYYDRLVPGVNYVPVAEDLSDLTERLTQLMSSDERAQQIGENGRKLALSMTVGGELTRAAEAVADRLHAGASPCLAQ